MKDIWRSLFVTGLLSFLLVGRTDARFTAEDRFADHFLEMATMELSQRPSDAGTLSFGAYENGHLQMELANEGEVPFRLFQSAESEDLAACEGLWVDVVHEGEHLWVGPVLDLADTFSSTLSDLIVPEESSAFLDYFFFMVPPMELTRCELSITGHAWSPGVSWGQGFSSEDSTSLAIEVTSDELFSPLSLESEDFESDEESEEVAEPTASLSVKNGQKPGATLTLENVGDFDEADILITYDGCPHGESCATQAVKKLYTLGDDSLTDDFFFGGCSELGEVCWADANVQNVSLYVALLDGSTPTTLSEHYTGPWY